jgi:hypothetical protein
VDIPTTLVRLRSLVMRAPRPCPLAARPVVVNRCNGRVSSPSPRVSIARLLNVVGVLLLALLAHDLRSVHGVPTNHSLSVAYSQQRVAIRVFTADSSSFFLSNAATQYSLFRDDIDIEIIDVPPVAGNPAPRLAWQALQRGEADVAFLPFVPTAAQEAKAPDLMYLPFSAIGFTAVYNLPELSTNLVLTPFALGRIYTGNITRSVGTANGCGGCGSSSDCGADFVC